MKKMETNVGNIMDNSFDGLKKLIDVNTIIGEQIVTADGTTIIPISKVTFGYGLGGSDFGGGENKKQNFAGGSSGGVTIQPIAFLIVKDGNVQVTQLASPNNVTERMVNMVPDVVDKISGIINQKNEPKHKNGEKKHEHKPQETGSTNIDADMKPIWVEENSQQG